MNGAGEPSDRRMTELVTLTPDRSRTCSALRHMPCGPGQTIEALAMLNF